MKKFLIVERQGGGCDYTIGCGIKVSVVECESMEALLEKTHAKALSTEDDEEYDELAEMAGSWLASHESSRESVSIYEIAEHRCIPLNEWKNEKKKLQEEAKDKALEAKERAELERLQKKFKK